MTMWYSPRQINEGPNKDRWHYTVSNTSGSRVYPVGPCSEDCPGHETSEGATRHYVEALAAGEIRTREEPDEQRRCVVCGEWTQGRALLWADTHGEEIAICPDKHDARVPLRAALLERYRLTDSENDDA